MGSPDHREGEDVDEWGFFNWNEIQTNQQLHILMFFIVLANLAWKDGIYKKQNYLTLFNVFFLCVFLLFPS